MRSKQILTIALGVLGATAALSLAQAPPAGQRTGPGVQASQDSKNPRCWPVARRRLPPGVADEAEPVPRPADLPRRRQPGIPLRPQSPESLPRVNSGKKSGKSTATMPTA